MPEDTFNYKDCNELDGLIGKTIKEIRVSPYATFMAFRTLDDERLFYYADQDCCSVSWFHEILQPENLLGQTITGVRVIFLAHSAQEDCPDYPPEAACDEENGFVQFYKVTLESTRGYTDIIFRNHSNGYYGGWMEAVGEGYAQEHWGNGPELPDEWTIVETDWDWHMARPSPAFLS